MRHANPARGGPISAALLRNRVRSMLRRNC
jgi:hypothetical protein